MERRKVGAMEKTTPQLPSSSSSSSSSEVKVKVEPQMERNTIFNSQHKHNDLDRERELMQPQIREFQQFQQRQPYVISKHTFQAPKFLGSTDQVGITHIWNDIQLPLPGPVPGRPQPNFYQLEDQPKQLMQQMISQQQLLCSTSKVLRPHLNSHASKQPGVATPIASNETHSSDDGANSRKRSQERLSQVGELAQAQQRGTPQQQGFSQILETNFEERMIKMEERMRKFEERMTMVEEGMVAIVPQLADKISELEKKLENLAGIISKDTGNTATLVEGKLANLTISDIKPEEGYTCGEDFVHVSQE